MDPLYEDMKDLATYSAKARKNVTRNNAWGTVAYTYSYLHLSPKNNSNHWNLPQPCHLRLSQTLNEISAHQFGLRKPCLRLLHRLHRLSNHGSKDTSPPKQVVYQLFTRQGRFYNVRQGMRHTLCSAFTVWTTYQVIDADPRAKPMSFEGRFWSYQESLDWLFIKVLTVSDSVPIEMDTSRRLNSLKHTFVEILIVAGNSLSQNLAFVCRLIDNYPTFLIKPIILLHQPTLIKGSARIGINKHMVDWSGMVFEEGKWIILTSRTCQRTSTIFWSWV